MKLSNAPSICHRGIGLTVNLTIGQEQFDNHSMRGRPAL
jgi:hypothetical protein